ncbi:DMT family transporter [Ureibacillus thermophilus]|uniref:Multidrug efflux SMR transporter n=1 Tax=Ureibacillus thermophilus TaxID=367743 RepID=A0A4V1A3F5_9BACL|nr:multidrug efflux SMR transporter [Ureibacillus thermophilus]QBK27070.1 multidrug efflux SMR transporter [Ureibacillus thermophilus]
MAWGALILAGLFETLVVASMNQFAVRRSWQPIALFIGSFGGSLVLLQYAMQTIPMGTAYAVWTGIGVVGGTLVGMIFYNESGNWKRILCIFAILVATIGLKLLEG